MGSFQFFSPEGRSKVHSYILEGIGDEKELAWDDDEFVARFSKDQFEDYLWIEGKDRSYFANRIRSILATVPVGEWARGHRAAYPRPWSMERRDCRHDVESE